MCTVPFAAGGAGCFVPVDSAGVIVSTSVVDKVVNIKTQLQCIHCEQLYNRFSKILTF